MALDAETLKANESLKELSDDVINTITTLSKNDEEKVINTKIGEHHGLIEKDVKEVTGLEKKEGEKSYEYMKRALSAYKEKAASAETLQTQISDKESKIAELERKIAEGSTDEALKTQLSDAQSALTQLKEQYDTDKENWKTKETEFSGKLSQVKVDNVFTAVEAGLKFKSSYPESVQKTLLSSTKGQILGKYTPDFIDDGQGGKEMVFRDKDNEIVRNKANGLKPYTAEELMRENLGEVLDTGKNQKGSGSEEPGGGNEEITLTDLAGVKTQKDASDIIVKYLMAQGLSRGTAEFAEKQRKIWEDNKISSLPIK